MAPLTHTQQTHAMPMMQGRTNIAHPRSPDRPVPQFGPHFASLSNTTNFPVAGQSPKASGTPKS